jgi:hypothetical protein
MMSDVEVICPSGRLTKGSAAQLCCWLNGVYPPPCPLLVADIKIGSRDVCIRFRSVSARGLLQPVETRYASVKGHAFGREEISPGISRDFAHAETAMRASARTG